MLIYNVKVVDVLASEAHSIRVHAYHRRSVIFREATFAEAAGKSYGQFSPIQL